MLLLLDNHDSFTFNLAQYLGELGAPPKVIFADSASVEDVLAMKLDRLVISPGPGLPEAAGRSIELVRALASRVPAVPILGVCLGHQAIARAFGAEVARAPAPVHGKRWPIAHQGRGLFAGIASPLLATRYHSLAVTRASLPPELEEDARSAHDDVVMSLRHRTLPIFGLQFHPESIGTPDGHALLRNFLAT